MKLKPTPKQSVTKDNISQVLLMATIVAILLLSGSVLALAECPVGKNDDHLNIHRVMMNFGRFTIAADSISIRGLNPNELIKDSELSDAADKLTNVIDCAAAVLANPKGDMLPDRVDALSGKERDDYIHDFLYFIGAFKDEVLIYQNLFKQMLTQKPAERDYQALYEERLQVDELVNRAHKKL